MSHAYTNLLLHIVFATKDRGKYLTASVQSDFYPYLIALVREKDCRVDAVGGGLDHVHLLLLVPAKESVSELVKFLKANSSRWLRKANRGFAWQLGYAAFSVSQSKRQEVLTYIREQEEHHRRHRFEDEYIGLLKKNEIEFEERIWG
jgi:REP element-mobilizing transposase RayT